MIGFASDGRFPIQEDKTMFRTNLNIQSKFPKVTMAIGVFALAAACAPVSFAGCGDIALNAVAVSRNAGPFVRGVGPLGAARLAAADEQPAGASIVGMWKFTFTVDSMPIDVGYAQWHSDGTEITNSSRDPRTGNFCLGVWAKTGASTYKLNHQALNWDGAGHFVGPATIREEVTVSKDGNSFSGTFTIDLYDTNGNTIAHVAGAVTAERVTAD
jgi:hypothetical protein